jgi:hypothetical protein
MTRYCSGIASTSFANSSNDAGLMVIARRALPAPRIVHGFATSFPSVTAVVRIAEQAVGAGAVRGLLRQRLSVPLTHIIGG